MDQQASDQALAGTNAYEARVEHQVLISKKGRRRNCPEFYSSDKQCSGSGEPVGCLSLADHIDIVEG